MRPKHVLVIASIAMSQAALSTEVQELASGFRMPESVVLDQQRGYLYVSNVNAGVDQQDGNGSIGRIRLSDGAAEVDWISGLHSPKGLAIHDGYLYVADVGELAAIDLRLGKVAARFPSPAGTRSVLNGVAADKASGTIFVSDWTGGTVYRLAGLTLEAMFPAGSLPAPNGIQVVDKFLYVGMWGKDPDPATFATQASGYLTRFDMQSGSEQRIPVAKDWSNFDGIHVQWEPTKRIFATDYLRGTLMEIDPAEGQILSEVELGMGAADFAYVPGTQTFYVPIMSTGKVLSVRLR